MSRIIHSQADLAMRDLRLRYIPVVSTGLAIFLTLLPFIPSAPLLPDFGFLMLITWRLLRPEIWTARMALGLGLLSDLVAGHPLGQAMLLWTATFLVFDLVDARLGFRDYWMDWLIAAAALILHAAGAWYIALMMGSDVDFRVMLPQIGLSILAYPIATQIVVSLDRRRLGG